MNQNDPSYDQFYTEDFFSYFSEWNTYGVVSFKNMFKNANTFSANISNWSIQSVSSNSDALEGFLDGTRISAGNYSNFINNSIRFNKSNLTLDASNLVCLDTASINRNILISKGWIFNDLGVVPSNDNMLGLTNIYDIDSLNLDYQTETSTVETSNYDMSYVVLDNDISLTVSPFTILYLLDSGTQENRYTSTSNAQYKAELLFDYGSKYYTQHVCISGKVYISTESVLTIKNQVTDTIIYDNRNDGDNINIILKDTYDTHVDDFILIFDFKEDENKGNQPGFVIEIKNIIEEEPQRTRTGAVRTGTGT